MTGLRAYIKSILPESWEHVLRQERKLQTYIDYVYESLPRNHKGKYGWRYGKRKVFMEIKEKTPIYTTFNVGKSREGILYWKSVDNKIKDYQYLCM